MKIKNERLHFLFALLIQIALLAICMPIHRIFIESGSYILTSEIVCGQETKPTLGRLIFAFIAFTLFFICVISAEKLSKKGKIYLPFALGTLSGTFLWQCLGEDAWHFSLDGIYMIQFESISVLPIAILFLAAFAYIRVKNRVGWGV